MKAKALISKTHPAEYLIHKYWARKPHNILGQYINGFFKKGDLLLDPFCGSGVFLAEAKKKEIDCIGFDINPIACLLSEVTVNPGNVNDFRIEAEKIIEYAKNKYQNWYSIDGKPIRYLVHEIISKCLDCGNIGSVSNSKKIGSKYYCIKCNKKLSFNYENFYKTKISKIYSKSDNREYADKKTLEEQYRLSQKSEPIGNFNRSLVINRRILAFPNMKLSDLFTPRAFTIISDLFNEAHKIKNKSIKKAILLFLTSGVAQCSRLIPYRNNLSTGGPAWTIPGFWIAPLHLETNPIIHIEARYKKLVKGLTALNYSYRNKESKVRISNISAQKGIENLKNRSISGIFFDPPYGDNVPYVEFSNIWNLFLRKRIDYDNEIIVSDRKEFVSSWEKYEKEIKIVVSLFHKKLKKNGKIIMTFNNLDPKAWKIILNAFSESFFVCDEARYQIPAVISSKAQRASNTSYIGDYYCVFSKSNKVVRYNNDFYALTDKVKKVLFSRKGKAPINLINRMLLLEILNNNMDMGFVDKIKEAIIPIAEIKGEYYEIREELINRELFEKFDIENKVINIAISDLKKGKKNIESFYENVLEKTKEFGSPPLSEIKLFLKETVLFEKDYCYLQNIKNQLSFL
jgi:hypothetical protein